MAKTRKTAQRKRASKEANAANMAFLEEKPIEPEPGPSKKKQLLKSTFLVQKTTEPQPGPSNNKQRIEDEMPIKPLGLSYHEHVSNDMTVDQESPIAIEPNIVDNDATDPLELQHLTNGRLEDVQHGKAEANHVEQAAPQTTDAMRIECVAPPQDHLQCNTQIEPLQHRISELTAENTKLIDKNTKLESQNWKLQCKLVQDANKRTLFTTPTNKTGYPSPEWLLKASTVAKDSDYMFVKELMMYLWPHGVGRATTTGRASNNPSGAKKSRENATDSTAGPSNASTATNVIDPSAKLDPDKVQFIKASLLQGREILEDDYEVAQDLANKTVQLINRVLSNNPSMKFIG